MQLDWQPKALVWREEEGVGNGADSVAGIPIVATDAIVNAEA